MATAWRWTWKSMAKITIWSLYLTLVGIPIGSWMQRRLFGTRRQRAVATGVARAHVGGWPGYRTPMRATPGCTCRAATCRWPACG